MKTLLLMKHAESSWVNNLQDDWYRPLSENGIMHAFDFGELLTIQNLVPDLILASSAVRTHQTAKIVSNRFDRPCKLLSLDNLYLAEMEVYFQEIQRVPDTVRTLLVVGHCPSLNRILQVITERIEAIPISGAAHVMVGINSWKDFKYDVQGELVDLIKVTPPFQFFKNYRVVAGTATSRL